MTTPATDPAQTPPCDGRGFLGGEPCPWTGPDDRWLGDRARCVFHSEDPNKPPDRIRAEWDRMAAARAFDCTGWVIPFGVEVTGEIAQARFHGTNFGQEAVFSQASFNGEAWFAMASFRDTWFMGARFSGYAVFSGASFERAITFDQTQFGALARFATCEVRLLRFHRCQMGGVTLDDALGIAEAEYDACEWDTPPDRVLIAEERDAIGLRDGLPDGVAVRSGPAFQRAERVYREVRRSLESRKQFQQAGQFAHHELEMRRMAIEVERGKVVANIGCLEGWY
ncbi:MAG: hypothetical protein EXR52_07085 [Dehalococcoidia bacterium]|nr:hypothetical protein [Dehalococcoidia bacterium]